MKNRGSIIARQIIEDKKREEYYKKKAKRSVCIIDNKKQCDVCKYRDLCEDCEVKDEI